MVIPFEEALPVARERASIERRKEQVQRWMYDLRGRADIAVPDTSQPPESRSGAGPSGLMVRSDG